jgi:nucleoid-associated protein YgaU
MTTPIIGSHRANRSAAGGMSQAATGGALKSASPTGAMVRYASLTEDGNPANAVQFTINPTEMQLQHDATTTQKKAIGSPGTENNQEKIVLTEEAAIKNLGQTNLTLSNLIFTGAGVAKTCKQCFDWTNPTTTAACTADPKLSKLTFEWGPLSYSVFLTSASFTYKRFAPGGIPVRAEATLKFIVNPPFPTPTNPTSGGIQGRRSHTLVAGENLQHIAMANYGRPGAWRALAAANGIEDPLAVRPGTVIYVPASTELAELAGGSTR